jgi:hypothetical protein
VRRAGHSILLLAAAAGCSVNEYGTSRLSRWETDALVGYRLTAVGVHLDTRDRSPSLTIGRFEAFHVFPAACNDIPDVTALTTPDLFRRVSPQASVRRSVGVELVAGSGEAGITIGLREQARLLSLDRSADIRRHLVIETAEFRNSKLVFAGKCRLQE